MFATSVALASAAYGAPAHASGEITITQPSDALGRAYDAAAVSDERPLEPLPFARLDLAIMVLGGAILAVLAAGAPLLFRPLRLTSPAPVRAGRASGASLPAAESGTPIHAPA